MVRICSLIGMVIILSMALCSVAVMAEEKDTIKVGVPCATTGPFASTGQVQLKAVQLGVDECNAQGGLLGRQLEIIHGDTADGRYETIMSVGERLIGAEVDVVITGWCALTNADVEVFGEYDVPYLAFTANHHFSDAVERGMPKTGNCFEVCWDEYAYSLSMRDHLFTIPQKMGWTPPNKKIAMVKVDLPYCVDPADRFRELVEPEGYEFVIDEITQFGKVDWGSILTKIERAQPSYILLFLLDPTDSARFQTQFHDRFGEKGLQAIINYQYTPMIPEYLELTGKEASEGIIYMGCAIRDQDPRIKDYLKRWDDKFHERPVDGYAVITRDAFDIWTNAVKKVGCVDCYDQIISKIRGSLNYGLWGTYVFAPHDQTGIYGEDLAPVDWLQIRDGKQLQTYPDQWKMTEYQKPPWIK